MEKYINKIINADCLEFMKEIPSNSIDCIICDLPYGTTACSWDVIIPFDKLWKQYKRIRKDNSAIVLFGSEPFSSYLRMSNINEFRYDWIWNKLYGTNFFQTKIQPLKYHENISVFYKKQCVFNRQMSFSKKENRRDRVKNFKKECSQSIYGTQKEYIGTNATDELRNPISILTHSNQEAELHRTKRLHPTQKPIALLEYLIKTYSNEGDLILDNCSGSGTTAIAAHNLKRNFICIEKDKDYYNASLERLNNYNKGNI